jgi:hypothetical protein
MSSYQTEDLAIHGRDNLLLRVNFHIEIVVTRIGVGQWASSTAEGLPVWRPASALGFEVAGCIPGQRLFLYCYAIDILKSCEIR